MSEFNSMWILYMVIAYFIGNISPATVVGRLHGIDIKKEGSGNPGTTNVLRVLGAKAAAATLAIDVLKGVVPVLIGHWAGGIYLAQLCFVSVVFGHIWPVTMGFKGGKGVATSLGATFALNWISAFPLPFIALGTVALTGYMSLGSILAAIAYPFLVYKFCSEALPCAIFMAIIIVYAHRTNIKRLLAHEENKLTFGKAKKSAQDVKEDLKVVASDVKESVADALPVEAENKKHHYEGAEPAVSIEDQPVDYYDGVEIPRRDGLEIKRIAVIGAGSFGTALANVLVYNGHDVTMWARKESQIKELSEQHTNLKYLPGVLISDRIKFTNDIEEASKDKDIVVFAVPAQSFGQVAANASSFIGKNTIVVNLAKGIERGSLKTMSQVAKDIIPDNVYVALSGPSHAEEISRNFPTTVVVASDKLEAAETVQDVFMGKKFRVYTSDDVIGVELGGALKNVIAIATGISDGMKLGDNTKAALMTRGMHEVKRLGIAMGAKNETFAGLSGIGDLIVTCDSNLSRNRRCGILIGSGLTPEQAVEKIGTTVEGFYTVDAAYELAKKLGVEMPITDAIHACLKGKIDPLSAVAALMERDKKEETR